MKDPNRLPGGAEQAAAETPNLDQAAAREGPRANSAGSPVPRAGMEFEGTPAGEEAHPARRAPRRRRPDAKVTPATGAATTAAEDAPDLVHLRRYPRQVVTAYQPPPDQTGRDKRESDLPPTGLTARDFERLAIGPPKFPGESVPGGGTEKMTRWAVDIKASLLPRIMTALEARLARPDIDEDLKVHLRAQVLEWLNEMTARGWIDLRDHPPCDFFELYWDVNTNPAYERWARLRHFSWTARLRRQALDRPGPDAVEGEARRAGSSAAAPTTPQSSPAVAGDGPADAFALAESDGYLVCDDDATALDYQRWCRDRQRPCVTVAARGSCPADDRGAQGPAERVAVALSLASCPWNLPFEAQVEAMAACRACVPPGDEFGRFDIEREWVYATVPRDAAGPLAARLYAIAAHYDGPAWWFDPFGSLKDRIRVDAERLVQAEGGRPREPIGPWVDPPRELAVPPPRTAPDDADEYDSHCEGYNRKSRKFCMKAIDLAKAIRAARLPRLQALARARASDPEAPRGDRALYLGALDAITRDRRAAFWIDGVDASDARVVDAAVAGLRPRVGP